MADESTIVLGRLPERLNKYKNNDAFMCIALPDGSTGQILMRNGKAILYSKDGEIDLDAFKDKYGNYISNFVITGSLQIEGSFIAQDTAKLYFPNLKSGIMFLDENNQIKTTELFNKDFSDLDETKDFEYNITFTNSKSPLAKIQQFVDNALTYNPGKNILSVKNIKVNETISSKDIVNDNFKITNSINFYKDNNIVSRITTSGTYEILQNDGYSSVFITQENLTPTNGIPFRNFGNKAAAGLFKNGIGFLIGNTDAGWIRVINDGVDEGTLEIAVGDNGTEDIVFRKYNTNNKVTFELSVDDIARKEDIKELENQIKELQENIKDLKK